MRLILPIVVLVVVGLGIFAAYRSVGFVAVNRLYGCVEDDIDAINYMNTMVDVDMGLLVEDDEKVKAAADEAYGSYTDRECSAGISGHIARDLAEKQRDVESAAMEYFNVVSILASQEDAEDGQVLLEKYEEFRGAVASFDDAVEEAKYVYLLTF